MPLRIRTTAALALLVAFATQTASSMPPRRLPPVDAAPRRAANEGRSEPTGTRAFPVNVQPTRVAQAAPPLPAPQSRPPSRDSLPAASPASLPEQLPERLTPRALWWESELARPQRPAARLVPVDPQGLMVAALSYSDHVRAIREAPLIVEEEIYKARAAFDVAAFVESKFDDLSDPVGNSLTTGGPPRLNDHHLRTNSGMRKRTGYGGTLEAAQQVGLLDVEVASRDVESTYQEMQARAEALTASQQELEYLRARWRMLPGDERQVSFLLDETLDAHDRLLEAEAACARAHADYALSLARLRRATGELLRVGGADPRPLAPANELVPPGEPVPPGTTADAAAALQATRRPRPEARQ